MVKARFTRKGRKGMVNALETMPDEAFAWFVLWANGGAAPVYPDGLGGFAPDSRIAIEQLRAGAKDWLEAYQKTDV